MSDNEEQKMQTKHSSLEDSSGDESSSEAADKVSSKDSEPVRARKVRLFSLVLKQKKRYFKQDSGHFSMLFGGLFCG